MVKFWGRFKICQLREIIPLSHTLALNTDVLLQVSTLTYRRHPLRDCCINTDVLPQVSPLNRHILTVAIRCAIVVLIPTFFLK